jgi:hypothetical protein
VEIILSEKLRMKPRRALGKHQNATFSLYHEYVYQPNPWSERCSNPFSDSFKAKFAYWAFSEVAPALVALHTEDVEQL